MTSLLVEVIKTHPDAILPEYKTDGASGMDLVALEDCMIPGWIRRRFAMIKDSISQSTLVSRFWINYENIQSPLIDTGIAFSIPQGWEGQIRPRSSISKQRIHVCLGTIDSDYRGTVSVCMFNFGLLDFHVKKGDRIAQVVFAPVGRAALKLVDQFTVQTARGAGGWGSTGRRD